MLFERRALRSRLWSIGSAAFLCVLAAMCGALGFIDTGSGTDTRALVIFGLISLTLVGAAIRFSTSGMTVTADGVTVRELFRTTRLPWSVLRAVDVIPRRAFTYGNRRAEVADVERGGPHGLIRDPLAYQLGRAIFYPRIHYSAPVKGGRQTIILYPLGAYRPEVAQRRADELRELMKSHPAHHL
jgi:PH (Pleckstrin Homology) domain-containing protein